MNLKKRTQGSNSDAAVMMSPLIDCVFLLLIFFLVTSIIKRYERQIPIQLADPAADVASDIRSDAYRIALSAEGKVFREVGQSGRGRVVFEPVSSPDQLIADIIASQGPDAAVELVVEEQAPFQTVIDLLDAFQNAGLSQVRSRIRDGNI